MEITRDGHLLFITFCNALFVWTVSIYHSFISIRSKLAEKSIFKSLLAAYCCRFSEGMKLTAMPPMQADFLSKIHYTMFTGFIFNIIKGVKSRICLKMGISPLLDKNPTVKMRLYQLQTHTVCGSNRLRNLVPSPSLKIPAFSRTPC